jgi:hypothetical protein
MQKLCKYKNIFGESKKGIHSYRIFNIAIVDLGLTIFVAYLLSVNFNWNFILVLLIILVIGIIMHNLFCVETTIGMTIDKLF